MQIRNANNSGEKIELQMTPMIDIVFQLLVFFIMTFKIVSMEGDFNIRMPAAAPQAAPPEQMDFPPMKLYLSADADGTLTGIQLNESQPTSFQALNQEIQKLVGTDGGPGARESAEIEIGFDYDLRYEFVIGAVTAVSGTKTTQGDVVKLIEKIRFNTPEAPE
ncbi:MAG: biopolymer transporter ExbD [Rhodopirellula sp.]|nr:biopolymer transporter ExbD [Rhodopirellula sp.]|tara:strand:- start:574 stop:1062 length:489 start_codon:yes stop_codon:yes gene_type:complete